MTHRPPVSGEPSTEAGRYLLRQFYPAGNRLPVLEDEMRRDILAIEAEAAQDWRAAYENLKAEQVAEARAAPPPLDVEALQQAMTEAGLGVPYHDADPVTRSHAEEVAYLYLARLTSKEERP